MSLLLFLIHHLLLVLAFNEKIYFSFFVLHKVRSKSMPTGNFTGNKIIFPLLGTSVTDVFLMNFVFFARPRAPYIVRLVHLFFFKSKYFVRLAYLEMAFKGRLDSGFFSCSSINGQFC